MWRVLEDAVEIELVRRSDGQVGFEAEAERNELLPQGVNTCMGGAGGHALHSPPMAVQKDSLMLAVWLVAERSA